MITDNFHNITSSDQFKDLLSADLERLSLINFWAPWAEPCKQMNEFVAELAKRYPKLLVLQVEAEEQSDITESFNVEAVPFIVLLRGHKLLGKVSGADASVVTTMVNLHLGQSDNHSTREDDNKKESAMEEDVQKEESEEELAARMRRIMKQSHVVLLMKGEPDSPRCGFSRKAVDLLREQKVAFTHFDILEDEAVRQGLKKLNNWPTYPQFIVDGELVGGLDVVNELVTNDEFTEVFATKEESEEELVARMRGIMEQSPVVLFMKGEPGNPRCGFSKKAVNLLHEQKVAFTHFDILEDEAVRQGLKKLNNWPTYPQFVIRGEFVGGLDVVTDMVTTGEFSEVFTMA